MFILYDLLIALVIILIIWLIYPHFVHWYIVKAFDGSYNPKTDSIQVPTALPPQLNSPRLQINQQTGEYSITFGEGRQFLNGLVRIHYQGVWYSSHPAANETLLEIIETRQTSKDNALGEMLETIFQWRIPKTEITFNTSLWEYPENAWLGFELNFPTEISPTATEGFDTPIVQFPLFENASLNQRIFTYRNGTFCPPMNNFEFTLAPVVLFDDSRQCVLISALDNFLTNGIVQTRNDGKSQIGCGPNGQINKIPADLSYRYIMVFYEGINSTFCFWGDLLRKFHGVRIKDRYMDQITKYLSYFTDNGAFYYYNPPWGKKMDTALIAVKEYADREQIPIKIMQLDSWWYKKQAKKWQKKLLGFLHASLGGGLYGGAILWETDPQYWNMSVPELSEKLGNMPFIAHHRWYVRDTPLIEKFHFIQEGTKAIPDDPLYWDYIMDVARQNHIVTYEQDWMISHYNSFTHLRSEFGAAERWLTQMATAAAEKDITIQYCMATPAMVMTSLLFPNISHFRASNDYHPRWPHSFDVPYFTQASLLGRALGINPFKDVFQSTQQGRLRGERCPELEGLLSCLSAGPVAPGDEIGFINKKIVHAVCRNDGLLLKPDRPITPVDLMFIKHGIYYICSTESHHDDYNWIYTITINLWPDRVSTKTYTLKEIQLSGEFYEYDWFTQKGQKLNEQTPITQSLKFEQYKYRVYAPLLPNGIAIIGDSTKYATMNDKTFSNLQCNETECSFEVEDIQGETVAIIIYSEKAQLDIKVDDESVSLQTDPSSHLTKLQLEFGGNSIKKILIKSL